MSVMYDDTLFRRISLPIPSSALLQPYHPYGRFGAAFAVFLQLQHFPTDRST